jgi:hypothetical protein
MIPRSPLSRNFSFWARLAGTADVWGGSSRVLACASGASEPSCMWVHPGPAGRPPGPVRHRACAGSRSRAWGPCACVRARRSRLRGAPRCDAVGLGPERDPAARACPRSCASQSQSAASSTRATAWRAERNSARRRCPPLVTATLALLNFLPGLPASANLPLLAQRSSTCEAPSFASALCTAGARHAPIDRPPAPRQASVRMPPPDSPMWLPRPIERDVMSEFAPTCSRHGQLDRAFPRTP